MQSKTDFLNRILSGNMQSRTKHVDFLPVINHDVANIFPI